MRSKTLELEREKGQGKPDRRKKKCFWKKEEWNRTRDMEDGHKEGEQGPFRSKSSQSSRWKMKGRSGPQNLPLHRLCLSLLPFLVSPQISHMLHPSFACHILFTHVLHTSLFIYFHFPSLSLLFSTHLLFYAFSFSLFQSFPFLPFSKQFFFSFFFPLLSLFFFCPPLFSVYMTHFLGPGPINHSVVGLACLSHCLASLPHHSR